MASLRSVYVILLLLTVAWCAGIVAVPLLSTGEHSWTPQFLRSLYAVVCHQLESRSFHILGEPMAVCIRCTALYGGFLFSLLLYPVLRVRHRSLVPSPWILAVSLIPMIVDVSLNVTGLLSSSVFSRVFSGFAAGVVLPFYLLPPLNEAVRQIVHRHRGLSHA